MPKATAYCLNWVSEHGTYALQDDQHNEQTLLTVPGSQEWFAWLTSIPSLTFSSQHGQLTVRQETRRGGGTYCYAYRRRGEKMLKRYLGRTADLTPAHLEEVTLELASPSASHLKPESSVHDPEDILFATKPHVPRLRAQLVLRTLLLERPQQGMEGPLTLDSAKQLCSPSGWPRLQRPLPGSRLSRKTMSLFDSSRT